MNDVAVGLCQAWSMNDVDVGLCQAWLMNDVAVGLCQAWLMNMWMLTNVKCSWWQMWMLTVASMQDWWMMWRTLMDAMHIYLCVKNPSSGTYLYGLLRPGPLQQAMKLESIDIYLITEWSLAHLWRINKQGSSLVLERRPRNIATKTWVTYGHF